MLLNIIIELGYNKKESLGNMAYCPKVSKFITDGSLSTSNKGLQGTTYIFIIGVSIVLKLQIYDYNK